MRMHIASSVPWRPVSCFSRLSRCAYWLESACRRAVFNLRTTSLISRPIPLRLMRSDFAIHSPLARGARATSDEPDPPQQAVEAGVGAEGIEAGVHLEEHHSRRMPGERALQQHEGPVALAQRRAHVGLLLVAPEP